MATLEREPLLSNQSDSDSGEPERNDTEEVFTLKNKILSAAFILILVIWECGYILQYVPLNQVLEDNICRQFGVYNNETSAPDGGKVNCGDNDAVQAELALVRGWAITLNLLPGIITAVPYGILADKYGRKPILALSLFGLTMTMIFTTIISYWPEIFPVRLIWLASIFGFVGGSLTVTISLLFSVLSELVPDSLRSTAFSALGSASVASQVLMSPVASMLMRTNAWLSIFIGLGIALFASFAALFLPEPAPHRFRKKIIPGDTDENGHLANSRLVPENDQAENNIDESNRQQSGDSNSTSDHGTESKETIMSKLRDAAGEMKTAVLRLFEEDRRVTLLLSTMVLTTIGTMGQELMMQFSRKKYAWPWPKAALLMSFESTLVLGLLLIVLPGFNYLLVRLFHVGPEKKDLLGVKASSGVQVIANLMIGLSSTEEVMIIGMVLWCMGAAYGLILRSLLAQFVPAERRSTLFTAVSIVENLGSLMAGPLLAWLFRIGISLGWNWIGLPFVAIAGLFLISSIVLATIKV